MEKNKQDIYNTWFGKNPVAIPLNDSEFIKKRCAEYQERIIKRFFPENKNANILDIGSGYGFFMLACKQAGYINVSGVEIVDDCIQFAKEKLGLGNIYKGEIVEFLQSKPDASFDVICAIDVLEHLDKEGIMSFFSLVHKKLKSQGIFFFQVPNAGSLPGMYIFNSDLTHTIPFTDLLAKGLFQMAGFTDYVITTSYQGNFLKNTFFNILRRPLAKLLALDNPFVFSTNLIAVGTKK